MTKTFAKHKLKKNIYSVSLTTWNEDITEQIVVSNP